MTVQADLCQTWSQTLKTGFLVPWLKRFYILVNNFSVISGWCQCFLGSMGCFITHDHSLKSPLTKCNRAIKLIKSYTVSTEFLRHHFVVMTLFFILTYIWKKMSRVMRKPDVCLCENKGTDQLRSNCEADQHLCFRYMDSTLYHSPCS